MFFLYPKCDLEFYVNNISEVLSMTFFLFVFMSVALFLSDICMMINQMINQMYTIASVL